MNILLISDLHVPTRLATLPKELLHLAQKVDSVFVAGDFVDLQTVLALQNASRQFYAVHGNMDDIEVKDYLPSKMLFQIEQLKIGMCHGWGSPQQIRERILSTIHEKPDILFYGHTHKIDDSFLGSVRFINPGSFCDDRSFALVELCGNQVKIEFKRL